MYNRSLLKSHIYKGHLVMGHGVLQVFSNSPTSFSTSLLQVVYKSITCLLQVSYIQGSWVIGHWSWGIGQEVWVMGRGHGVWVIG